MRIGLLAPEENGKTSYLTALYAVLVHDKPDKVDYPVRYVIKDPVCQKELNDRFRKLIDESLPKSQRFPLKTTKDDLIEYKVEVVHKTTAFHQEVTLVDFPGELLRGSSEVNREYFNKVKAALISCDAYIVILDAEVLIRKTKYAKKARLSPSDINNLLTEVLRIKGDKYAVYGVPIAFCASKLDLLCSLEDGQEDSITEAYATIMELFPDLFSSAQKHPVMIAGVSLGQHIAGASGDEQNKDALGGPFEPFFIETPFEFCLSMCAYSAAKHHDAEEDRWRDLQTKEERKAQETRNLGFLEWLDEWGKIPGFFSTPTAHYEREARVSQRLSERDCDRSREFHSIGLSVIEEVAATAPSGAYAIFVGGRRYQFKKATNRWSYPLEPL